MNKIISSLAAIALLAVTLVGPVQAASINGATAALDGTLVVGQTITITKAGVFIDSNEITSATIKKLNGTAAGTTTLTAPGTTGANDTSKVTIATADLGNNTSYFIYFRTANNDFGVAQLNAGTPTTETVSVTATVDPILTFSLADYNAGGADDANVNVQLGTVDTDASNAAEGLGKDGNAITVATNAGSGIVVKAYDEPLGLRTSSFTGPRNNASTDGQINDISAGAFPAAGNEAFGYQTAVGIAPTGNFYPLTGATPVTLNNFTGPVGSGVVNILYQAQTAATTAAGSYNDVITYTVTPTF